MYYSKKLVDKGLLIVTALSLILLICYYINKERSQYIIQNNQSYFETVYLSKNTDRLQKVKLFSGEENNYSVFMPSEMLYDSRIYFDGFWQLQIGDVLYKTGDILTDIRKDSPYRMIAQNRQGEVIEEGTVQFYFSLNVPTIYIESDSGSLDEVNSQRDKKEKIRYTTINEEGLIDQSGKGMIKARGNTSFHAEQKSYSVNLDSSRSLLGLDSASEWAMIANYENTTHQLKNKIVLDLAKRMGMPYTPDCKFVNVYLNNQYNGLYLLAQKVSADGGSVHLEKENEQSSISGPYLLEFDARYEREPVWFQTEKNNVVVKYPKNVSDEMLVYIKQHMLKAEFSVQSISDLQYKDYIDLDTWTSMYLMQEFFVQQDVEFASFYMYKYADNPLIYAGPVWDFDLAYGRIYHGYYPTTTLQISWLDERGGLLGTLDNDSYFEEKLTEKYLQSFSPILEKYLEEEVGIIVDTIVFASWMNSQRWERGATDIWTDAESLLNWIAQRKQFMDDYMSNKDSYRMVKFHMDWGSMNYLAKSGEKLGFLPSEKFGEVASLNDPIGWRDKNGNEVDADMTIYEETDLYAVYENE